MESSGYKSVLLQRDMLETLRAHVSVTDDLLDTLYNKSVLSSSETKKIKALRWPLNRQELLQVLVRKQWKGNEFIGLVEALEGTQAPVVTSLVKTKAEQLQNNLLLKEENEDNEAIPVSISCDFKDSLDAEFGGKINNQVKTYIRREIAKRDAKISQLEEENKELGKRNVVVLSENHSFLKNRENLERQIADLISALNLETLDDSTECAITALGSTLIKQKHSLHDIIAEKHKVDSKMAKLVGEIRSLKNETRTLKKTKFEQQNILEECRLRWLKETDLSKKSLEEYKSKTNKLEKTLKLLQEKHEEMVSDLSSQLLSYKTDLDACSNKLKEMESERAITCGEVGELEDRCRKLLLALDLPNNCTTISKSVDHARNLVISKKRNGIVPFATKIENGQEKSTSQQSQLPILEGNGTGKSGRTSSGFSSPSLMEHETPTNSNLRRCSKCKKMYDESKNFDYSCLYHKSDATLLHKRTSFEVWSCCKSQNSIRGCQRGKHTNDNK